MTIEIKLKRLHNGQYRVSYDIAKKEIKDEDGPKFKVLDGWVKKKDKNKKEHIDATTKEYYYDFETLDDAMVAYLILHEGRIDERGKIENLGAFTKKATMLEARYNNYHTYHGTLHEDLIAALKAPTSPALSWERGSTGQHPKHSKQSGKDSGEQWQAMINKRQFAVFTLLQEWMIGGFNLSIDDNHLVLIIKPVDIEKINGLSEVKKAKQNVIAEEKAVKEAERIYGPKGADTQKARDNLKIALNNLNAKILEEMPKATEALKVTLDQYADFTEEEASKKFSEAAKKINDSTVSVVDEKFNQGKPEKTIASSAETPFAFNPNKQGNVTSADAAAKPKQPSEQPPAAGQVPTSLKKTAP